MAVTRAVFLDKDGTLVDDVPYNVSPDRIRLAPGAGPALRALSRAGYRLVVVSNQSGVARGRFEERALRAVEERLSTLLAAEGVTLEAFAYCPHLPEGVVARYAVACGCRKPKPGLLLRVGAVHRIDLRSSWMVGDILDDVEAGRAAGCRTVLVDVGTETAWERWAERTPDHVVHDLLAAARAILAEDRRRLEPVEAVSRSW